MNMGPWPVYEWPEPSAFEEWDYTKSRVTSEVLGWMSRHGYPVPDAILVPNPRIAWDLAHTVPPRGMTPRRPTGITVVETIMYHAVHCFGAYERHKVSVNVHHWRWVDMPHGDEALAVIADIHGECIGCKKPWTSWPLTNNSPSHCMRCLAVYDLAKRMLDDPDETIDKLVDATEIVLVNKCSSGRQWGRKTHNWSDHDWSQVHDNQLRRDAAIVAILSGLAGPGEVDLSGVADESHEQIANRLRTQRRPARPRRLPNPAGRSEG